MTVTGKTLSENAKLFPSLSEGQQVIRPLTNPIKETGHIQILYGNLAPEGSVAKITRKEGLYFSGAVLCSAFLFCFFFFFQFVSHDSHWLLLNSGNCHFNITCCIEEMIAKIICQVLLLSLKEKKLCLQLSVKIL
ncbi:hypothetical protein ACSBR2_018734 [Camellia fascicularis]